jgi:hypothetical protein
MNLKNIENNIWDNIDLNLELIKKPINQNNQYLIHYAIINSNLDIIQQIINLDENNILFINKEIFINIAKLGKFNFILKLLEIVNSTTRKYILEPFKNKEDENEWIIFYFLYNANFDYINELFKYSKYINWNYIIDNNYCLKIYLLKNYKNISEESYNIFLKILENTNLKKLSEDYCSIIIDSCLFEFNKRVLDKIIEVFPDSVNIIKSNQLSPLLAAINRENNELINYLLDNGANYNYNTYINPLIFAIKLNNDELVKRLLKYKDIDINFFDLNKWQAVHHIFNKSKLDIELKKDIILKTDNLNIQNTSGNTAIHLMFLNENWRDYIEQLKNKVIDIYCKNKLELSPLDNLIIKIKDNDIYNYQYEIDSLLQLVASSFLTNTKRLTYNNNKISKNFARSGSGKRSGKLKSNVLYNLSLKCLKNETSNCINSLARKIEKLKISKIDADVDNDKIDLISGDKTDYNLFISRDVDSYIYLLYFIEKYKVGILSSSKDDLIIKIKKPEIEKIINFYVGISNKYNNIKNLSIYWHDKNNNVFPNNLSSLPSIKKDIILILVTIINPDIDHANCLIVDKKNKRIVHFEPYGRVNKQNLKDFDNTCIAIFKKIFPDFKYFKPDDYMTQNSFQMLSNETNPLEVKTGDIGGFCLAWTLWFFELYLRNPNVDLSNLVNNSISKIINLKYSFMEYIRFYANKLRRFHIKFLKKIKYPVEKIFNVHTTVNEKDYIYNSINNHIGKYI